MVTKHVTHHFSTHDPTHLESIEDYMTSPVIGISSNCSVKEAVLLMKSKNIGSLFVKEKNEFVGMISDTSISHSVIAGEAEPESTKVSQIMIHPIPIMDHRENLEEANSFMARNNIRHLGVTKNGEIIGVLSVKDLISFFANPRLRIW
jgi:signal-transduction protein with cAMP-binding, CBS, and nucleotidyltransferase domain